MYPEWIQEQLDKLFEQPTPVREPPVVDHRIIQYVSYRLNRIEAKIDRLLAFCEGE